LAARARLGGGMLRGGWRGCDGAGALDGAVLGGSAVLRGD